METLNYNMTAKDLFNAKSSSKKVADYIGVTIIATGCALVNDVDKNGDAETIGYIATTDGVFGFTSVVLTECLPDLAAYMETVGEPIDIMFASNISNSGKTFYTVEVK